MDFDAELDKLVAAKNKRDADARRAADYSKDQQTAFLAVWAAHARDVVQPTLDALADSARARGMDVKVDYAVDVHTGAIHEATLTAFKPLGPLKARSYLKVQAGVGSQRVVVESYIHGSGAGAVTQTFPIGVVNAEFLKKETMAVARSIIG
ncbi:MAG TPA: hypothetical protein VM621_05070 [Luteibacter sp.]|uniref:hypothetical protein n=1 Tax=Luteibacter sp. TaxID=1886636 RepID=UPI002BDDB81C|nr:hypothetical protein [Luteibacter sp.]HVI54409.1 hypothetical protein [Luteibacter sp.]